MSDLGPAQQLLSHAAKAPARIALATDREDVSYGDLAAAVERAALRLRREGVVAGTTVTIHAAPDVAGIADLLAIDLLEACARVVSEPRDMELAESGEPALVHVATSGSTGVPRWVPLTRENVSASVAASRLRLENSRDDTWLLCLPLHHVAGLSVLWRSIEAGGSMALQSPFDARRVAGVLKGTATVGSLVPTMLRRTLDAASSFESVRWILIGGAASASQLLAESSEAGLPALATYGTTETGSQVATVAPGDIEASVGTSGYPLDSMEVTISPAGEILVDGPAVFAGYVGEDHRAGPHQTRDAGRFDSAGRLVVESRLDEMINTGGEKAYPTTIEHTLEGHPGVDAAFVYGAPDEEWGARVEAIVESSTVSSSDVIAYAKDHLREHEVPKRVVVVSMLPKLDSGKVDRVAAAEID